LVSNRGFHPRREETISQKTLNNLQVTPILLATLLEITIADYDLKELGCFLSLTLKRCFQKSQDHQLANHPYPRVSEV